MPNYNHILYARVSSNSGDQIRSLKNQIDILENKITENKWKNYILLSDVKSASDGMSAQLKETILDMVDKAHLVVVEMDRLTRDIADIKFIKNHVEYITVINDNKTYYVKSDWKSILDMLVSAHEEIEKIKKRLRHSYHLQKRPTSDAQKYVAAKKRSMEINNLISNKKIKTVVEDVSKMISLSQNLKTKKDWSTFAHIYSKYDTLSIKDTYRGTINNLNNDSFYHIPRSDITDYVTYIFDNLDIELDRNILKEYINANINLGRKLIYANDESDPESSDDQLSNLVNSLFKLSINDNVKKMLKEDDMNKLKKITKKLNNVMDLDDNDRTEEKTTKPNKKPRVDKEDKMKVDKKKVMHEEYKSISEDKKYSKVNKMKVDTKPKKKPKKVESDSESS